MFGPKRDTNNPEETTTTTNNTENNIDSPSALRTPDDNASRRAMRTLGTVNTPAPQARITIPGRPSGALGATDRSLTVPYGLKMSGEISSCDVLIVEGSVEAKLSTCKMLQVTESGQFRGSVEIENADIAGRFDGSLVVHGRLIIRSTGKVNGTVKYSELEVHAGGQVIGDLQVTAAQQSGVFRSAAKVSFQEENEQKTKTA